MDWWCNRGPEEHENNDPERISVEACGGGQGSPRAVAPFDDDETSYIYMKLRSNSSTVFLEQVLRKPTMFTEACH